MADLTREDAPTAAAKTYALQIADTVVIGPGKVAAEVATGEAPKGWGDVAWMLNVSAVLLNYYIFTIMNMHHLSFRRHQNRVATRSEEGHRSFGDAQPSSLCDFVVPFDCDIRV